MKVVLLAPTPPPAGGMASWTKQILYSPLKNGWQIELIDTKVIGGREVYGTGSRRKIQTELKRCFSIWSRLSKKIKDDEVAVVHSNIPSLPLSMLREYVCAFLTKMHKKKFIIHFHCTVPNTTRGKFTHLLLKRLCNKSDCIIALNEQTRLYLMNITRTNVRVIPNFIEERQVASSRIVSDSVRRVLYVGGVIKSKGVLQIIEVAKYFPQIEFRFVGRVDEEILRSVADSGTSNLVFMGEKSADEVASELGSADVFMFLSHFPGEGFSVALTEAMAAGLPCIVTDWAANGDMIDDGAGGFVIPVDDVQAAIEAMKKIQAAETRAAQSEHNIKKVKRCYVASRVKAMYVDLYEQCIAQKQ